MNAVKQRRFYKPEIMLNLVTQIKERGDIIKIVEEHSFSENGFRKALKDYKDFYHIQNKAIHFQKTQKLKKLKSKLEFIALAYTSWKKGIQLKEFAKTNNIRNDTAIHKLTRLGIFWKKSIDPEVTDNTFKSIISEFENEIRDIERDLCKI